VNDTAYVTTFTTDLNTLDAQNALGAFGVTYTENPSASLNVRVAGGTFRKSDGTVVTVATSTQAMTANATNSIWVTDIGTLAVATTGFPAATNIVRVATVVAGATSITSVSDARLPYTSFGSALSGTYLALAGGTLADAANIALGTTTGTQLGTATSQKLGFYGATPVTQRTNANQAALTDNTGGIASTTFTAIAAGASYAQSDMVAVKNALSQVVLSVNEIRTSLVNLGLIKGS
jgi:hypothetical protein